MSKLRADEFVNSDDNGAPSFPHSATVPAPTADDHFANKLYTDTSASTKSTTTTITNTISNTAPSNPSVGDFWTDTSESIIALGIWNGVSWVNVKNSLEIDPGQIITPPTISDPNGGYIPTMLTAASAVVSGATLSSSKWYKDDVELPGSEGSLQFYATDTGTYKYEEIWVDTFGTELFPSLSAVIDARAGVIDAQPTITSSNGVYSPTTLTATPAVVSNATLVGSRWYKDGVEIPDSSGLSINILAHEGGIYKYEETWTDHFGTQLLPTLSASVQVFATIADPTVLTPAYGTGTNPDFDYTAESSAIINVVDIPGGGMASASYNYYWDAVTYGGGKFVAVASRGNSGAQDGSNQVMYSTDGINWTGASTPAGGRKSIVYGAPSTGTYAGTDIFVAVGAPSSMYSTDGINWSASNAVSGAWNSVAYGNGTFVAVAWSGGSPDKRIMYSTDGMNWTSIYAPDNNQWKGVTYANGKFVACASSGTYPIIYSSDGINWTRANQPPIQYDWEDIVYGGDKFVCIGFNANKVIYSSDGISWTAATVPEANYWRAITYGDGKFVAVSSNGTNRVMYSTDGINWTATNGLEDNGWYGVGYGDGKFVAVAEFGDNRVMYSVDGANWTQNFVGLTLTDTTVSRASDGSLIEGTSIDQVLTVGEGVTSDNFIVSGSVESISSTTLYTGNGGSQTITNGIDLAGEGGMVWIKNRSNGGTWRNHVIVDSERIGSYGHKSIYPNTNEQEYDPPSGSEVVTAFNSNGFTQGGNLNVSNSGGEYVSWTFRKAPGFFDIVTWGGTGSDITLSHDLGSVPGMIITKRLDSGSEWYVYHKSLPNATENWIRLGNTAAANGPIGQDLWGPPTSSTFKVDTYMGLSTSGASYVSYLFADDTSNQIKCGTYNGSDSSVVSVDCGFRPGLVIIKCSNNSAGWGIYDDKRNAYGGGSARLSPNTNSSEYTNASLVTFTSTGFDLTEPGNSESNYGGNEYIYVAIAENPVIDNRTTVTQEGTIIASSGNTITLSDVSGTWSNGMKVRGATTDFYDSPDPINPSQLSLTSSEPATTQGSVTTWGNAQWQVAEDSGFTTNTQSLTSALTSSGTQTGPTGFTLDYNKNYYVRTKYGSSNPAGIFSNWSVPSLFKTGPVPLYADDVFSVDLYSPSGLTTTVNNGIDFAGEGGMVLRKRRDISQNWTVHDTERGDNRILYPNLTSQETTGNTVLTSGGFTSTGLVWDTGGHGGDMVNFSFRKAPGFFDIVTYTGNGTAGRTIEHNLGSVPGFIIVKNRTYGTSTNWRCYHRSLGANKHISLDRDTAASTNYQTWNDTAPTSTVFSVGSGSDVNASGNDYVAYVFAHDDARFGTSGAESIIKCGSYTGNGSESGNVIDLGFEPQWLMIRRTSSSDPWNIWDTMRGMANGSQDPRLEPNTTDAEDVFAGVNVLSTGFELASSTGFQNSSGETYIYVAIRRPHKPPTSAMDVFALQTTTPEQDRWTPGFAPDVLLTTRPSANTSKIMGARLTGPQSTMTTTSWAAESSGTNYINWDDPTGTISNTYFQSQSETGLHYAFKRAPGFMDVISYTGDGTINRTIPHNLGVSPELVIIKRRSQMGHWWVDAPGIIGSGKYMYLERNNALGPNIGTYSAFGTHTATTIGLETVQNNDTNHNTSTHVAYLFASLDGISKVGSYTGTGSNINVDCGFTAGARFVLIKRTDSSGDWHVWDTERGIVSGHEPFMYLNEPARAQIMGNDYIDPLNAGFTVTSSAPADLNASGGTYLFLAIA